MQSIKHIAFIMDGNGRWAKKRLLPRSMGHEAGLKTMEAMCDAALKADIKQISFFAFSTENWLRPKREVNHLMKLLKQNLPVMAQKIHEKNCNLVFTGDISAFTPALQDVILSAKDLTKNNSFGVINICLNYGGRNEIVNAVNLAVKNGKAVDGEEFSKLLYTHGLSDPDLLIRTGGEMRLSNFMLYQMAYTELYFSPKLWPDFTEEDFFIALDDFKNRSRRYGKV